MSLITINSLVGCGSEKIASSVANDLGIDLIDDKRLQKDAFDQGFSGDDLKGLNEKAPGFFDLLRGQRPEIYLNLMESLIYNVAKKGEGVIIGHGSHFLLRDFHCALHVLISASEAYRIQQLDQGGGLDEHAAIKLIRKSDRGRKGFLKYAFHMDWDDFSIYDLVVNPEKIGPDGAARLISSAALSPEIKECGLNALNAMDQLSLTKKIEAALLKNNYNPLNFHVEALDNGVVDLTGFVSTEEEKEAFVKTVKAVPGVISVNAGISIIQPHI